jgi:hypothetical protein
MLDNRTFNRHWERSEAAARQRELIAWRDLADTVKVDWRYEYTHLMGIVAQSDAAQPAYEAWKAAARSLNAAYRDSERYQREICEEPMAISA